MKTLKKVMLSAFVATLLISCAKTESEINTNLKTAQTSPSYYEDLYDQHINAAGFGMLGLANNSSFVAVVKDACDLQFDGDDNVLFKQLNDIAAENEINLAAEMEASLTNLDKEDLIPMVDGVINGFDYFDTKIYLQIYIPFIENYNAEHSPWISLNHNDDDVLPSYRVEGGVLNYDDIDEGFAMENTVWVISGNETVDNTGNIVMEERDLYHKDAKINKIKIIEKKESWGNGRADISYIAYHINTSNCSRVGDPFAKEPYIRIENTWLNLWRNTPNIAYLTSRSNINYMWNPNKNILVLMYEKDVRVKFGKTTNGFSYVGNCFCSNNPSGNFFYISKETPYGVLNLTRGQFHNPILHGSRINIYESGINSQCISNLSGASFEISTYNAFEEW